QRIGDSDAPATGTPRLDRLAKLVAIGQASLPADLAPHELEILADEISRLRRQRLLQHIARVIALDIHRESGH
ncbi:MAG: hypothetical protein KY475_26035, partial [Planctomycetes bacterium]|nr:hypothetical protein [Planctomycetota bacterium]